MGVIFYYRIVISMVRCNFLQIDENKWGSPSSFSSCKGSKLKLRVFLAGHIVAMVIYCVTKIIPIMAHQKLLETVLSHRNTTPGLKVD